MINTLLNEIIILEKTLRSWSQDYDEAMERGSFTIETANGLDIDEEESNYVWNYCEKATEILTHLELLKVYSVALSQKEYNSLMLFLEEKKEKLKVIGSKEKLELLNEIEIKIKEMLEQYSKKNISIEQFNNLVISTSKKLTKEYEKLKKVEEFNVEKDYFEKTTKEMREFLSEKSYQKGSNEYLKRGEQIQKELKFLFVITLLLIGGWIYMLYFLISTNIIKIENIKSYLFFFTGSAPFIGGLCFLTSQYIKSRSYLEDYSFKAVQMLSLEKQLSFYDDSSVGNEVKKGKEAALTNILEQINNTPNQNRSKIDVKTMIKTTEKIIKLFNNSGIKIEKLNTNK